MLKLISNREMKSRVSHFQTKNIEINNITRPIIKSVQKTIVNNTITGRQPLSSSNIRVSLSTKLGVVSKKVKIVQKEKPYQSNRVNPIEQEAKATVLERNFYKENSKYAYTPEQHHQLNKIHYWEKLANNSSK